MVAEAPGARPRGRRAEGKRTVRWPVRMPVTDRHSDRHFLSPLVGTEKPVRKGVTPFAPYIILYKGEGCGILAKYPGALHCTGPHFPNGVGSITLPGHGGPAAPHHHHHKKGNGKK